MLVSPLQTERLNSILFREEKGLQEGSWQGLGCAAATSAASRTPRKPHDNNKVCDFNETSQSSHEYGKHPQ